MKYMNFDGLSHFLSKLTGVFSAIGHTHTKSEITDYVVDSAMSSTSTNPVQNKVVNTALNAKVPTSRKVNGKALSADITLSASDVGAEASGNAELKANEALASAKSYTDSVAANKVDKVSGKGLSTNDYTTTEKNKLSGIASGAEVNQNAFSNVKVGTTTIAADAKTDTLTIEAGANVTITPDTTNDKVTISATDTVYTHPSHTSRSSGLYKITVNDTGHVSAVTAVAKADITGLGIPAQDTTYSAATTEASGLMSASDKAKLDGIASGANKITVDSALSSTSTNPVQNKAVQTALNGKVPTSRTINGKALSANITLSASDVGADASGTATTKADAALASAKSYTDTKVAALVDSAPATLDTLAEVATAIQENETVVEALNAAIGNKVDKVSGKGLSTNDYTTTEKNKLSGIASGAEVNQNAFSTITVGSTAIAADSKTDTFTIVAGDNVTLTPDTTNDKMTISAKDTVYTHPTYTARTGVPTANQTPAFGGTFSVSQPVSDGTGHITAVNSRTITIPNATATTSADGLMSSGDKTKLDGIATGANKTTVDSTMSTSSTNPVQNKVVQAAITAVSDAATANYNKSITGLSVSGKTVTYTKGDGTTGTITTQDTNTDTKVTQTVTTSDASYPLLLAPSGQTGTKTTTAYFDSGVTLNPSTNTIAANISGNAATATLAETANHIGSYSAGNIPHNFNTTIPAGQAVKITFNGTFGCSIGCSITNGNARYFLKASGCGVSSTRIDVVEEHRGQYFKCYIPDDEQAIVIVNSQPENRAYVWVSMDYGTDPTFTVLETIPEDVTYYDKLCITTNNLTTYVTPAKIGAATVNHNHSASDITSGTLSIARGGTGATTAAGACKNLGAMYLDPNDTAISGEAATVNANTFSGMTYAQVKADILNSVIVDDDGQTGVYSVNGQSGNVLLSASDVGAAESGHNHDDVYAAKSHGNHVSYSTTAPAMDGTASVGSASTVARSDHKHPTDTSRASASAVTTLQGLVGDSKVSEQISSAISGITYSTVGAAAASHTHPHTHDQLQGWSDTRNVTTKPNDYNSALKCVGIKTPTGSGTIDGSSYSTLVGIRGWSDSSGGNSHEIAFTGNGKLYHRHGSTDTWGSWGQILTSANFSLSGSTLTITTT